MDLKSFRPRDSGGLHYAVRIFAGTTAVWLLLRALGDANPVWAVIALIMVTEPETVSAWHIFLARMFNTVIGCVAGLLVLVAAGPQPWVLPLAVTITVLVCTYVFYTPQAWRVGPVTAAVVLAAGVAAHSRRMDWRWRRNVPRKCFWESVVALVITWLASLIWPLRLNTRQPAAEDR